MNEFPTPDTPDDATPQTVLPQIAPPYRPKPISYWLKKLLACNPFYLVSAALLLYGFYLVSNDGNFLRGELSQLMFNFTSLQLYEVTLVAIAILLARRFIWYDSTLLLSLENMLLLVPFILISQAGLIAIPYVWLFSLFAAVVAIGRFGGLKHFIHELNLPSRMSVIAFAVLVANVALPIVYRTLHETKWGTKPDWGAAYYTNECAWLLLLPLLVALAFLLPPNRNTGELLPQRAWLPSGWFSLWLIGTALHLYCLGYVYDFTLRHEFLAPALWTLVWAIQVRTAGWIKEHVREWSPVLLCLPMLPTLLGIAEPWNGAFLALTMLNVLAYALLAFANRKAVLLRHLLAISLIAFIAGLPEAWGRTVLSGFTHMKCAAAGAAIYLIVRKALSRNPKHGILGSLVVAVSLLLGLSTSAAAHWALHAALVFLLLHSLRWDDSAHAGARALRYMAAAFWLGHAIFWLHAGGAAYVTSIGASLVLAIYLVFRLLTGTWGPRIVALAAGATLLSGPGDFTAEKVQALPVGILAVLGSFLLLGIGTLLALTRPRWLR